MKGDTEDPGRGQIPSDYGKLFEELRSDVVWLHARWKLYEQLYQTNPIRVKLLAKTAATFFQQLHVILLDDAIIGIARITDPAKTTGRDNRSLWQLHSAFPEAEPDKVKAEIEAKLEKLKSFCKPFRDHRNKRVAHRDLNSLSEGPARIPLPTLSVDTFKDAFGLIADVMNAVENHFTNTMMGYEHFEFDYMGDAEGLVWELKKAALLDKVVDPLKQDEKIRRETEFGDA